VWNDKELRKKVEEYLGEIPEFFQQEPRAVLFRNIASPDLEFLYWLDMAKTNGLSPLVLTYNDDKFCTRNSDKLGLCRLNIFEKRNKNGDCLMHYKKIVNLKSQDNKKFSEIHTLDGKSLLDFHKKLLMNSDGKDVEVVDMSAWIEKSGGKAVEYYKKFFAFFIYHGILFENFVTDDSESEFEKAVILPAKDEVEKFFGIKPLIVPLAPDPEDVYWWCYPSEIENFSSF